ncbi:MAG: hypothetical protein LIO79_01495 [Rikenellaceae bacterium]|nr:hypothetical protein [Rikenellaceae bacterium]
MKNLITADEVIEIAFTYKDQISRRIVTDCLITTAQVKFIKPVLGKLFTAIMENKFDWFNRNYIKPPLAFFVKYLTFAELSTSTGNIGVFTNRNTGKHYLTHQETMRYRRETKKNADILLEEAINYIFENTDQFEGFLPPIRNSRIISGGFIL